MLTEKMYNFLNEIEDLDKLEPGEYWSMAMTDAVLNFIVNCHDDEDYVSLNEIMETLKIALFNHEIDILTKKEAISDRFLAAIINAISLTMNIKNKLPNRKILLNKYKEFCKRFFPDEEENPYLQ